MEQVGLIVRGKVDEMEIESFLFGPGDGLADRLFSFLRVASAARDVGAEEGRGVILDFGLHCLVRLAAAEGDGMGGSGIGAIGHGGDVGGLEDEESGGGGAGAAGRHEDDDGDGGRFDFGDDFAGGVEQAAGGIDLDQQSGGVTRPGGIDGARDPFGGDGLDGAVDVEAQDLRGGREGSDEQQKRGEERAIAFHGKPPAPHGWNGFPGPGQLQA